MGRDHDVVSVDHQIAHRGRRQVQPQRRPRVAVVERNPHAALGPRVKQPAALRVGAHDVGRGRVDAAIDLRPVGAAVVGAKELRALLVEADAVDRDVRARAVERRRVDDRDLRPGSDPGRRDVTPMLSGVGGAPHPAVVGAGPDHLAVARREAERVDDAAMRALRRGGLREGAEVRRRRGFRTAEVGADDPPVRAVVGRLEQYVRAEIERVRIGRRERQRRRALEAIVGVAAPRHDRTDLARLAGRLVEARHLAAIDDAGMQRVGRDVAVLFGADGMPVAKRERAVVTAREHLGAPALLLAAVHAVRKAVVGDHVVELRGRLVVPRAPRRSAVERNDRALIAAQQDLVRVRWFDPDAVVVVAARRAAPRIEGLPAVG